MGILKISVGLDILPIGFLVIDYLVIFMKPFIFFYDEK